VAGEVVEDAGGEPKGGTPEPAAAVALEQHDRSARREAKYESGGAAVEAPAVATELYEPGAPLVARNRRGQVKAEGGVRAEDGESRRERGRRVDDEQVARIEQLRKLGEDGVVDTAAAAAGDEQADVVATGPADLGRLAGLGQRGRLLSFEGDAHAWDGLSSRAA
jgi:hypothetical protein